jgi:SAM-dependent methyltransferase
MNQIESNNKIAEYEEGWFFHDHAWDLLHIILKEIKTIYDKYTFFRMLDFGAGSGIAAKIIKAVIPDIDIFVLDKDINSREFFNQRKLAIIDFDFAKDFDYHIILCSHVIEHLENPGEYLKKFAKIAKHLILIVPDGQTDDLDHKHIFNRRSFKKLIDDNIEYKRIKYYPHYHPHINNLVAVIDL